MTRLQTLDRGAPVSVYTVAKGLGHGGDSLVKRVYGQLGEVPDRSEVVEYRVGDHTERLRERLAKLSSAGTVAALSPHVRFPGLTREGAT